MLKIKYKLKKISHNIYAVIADNYTRSMLFLRIQEFYENKKFKNKKFSFWEHKKWYSLKNKGNFTYTSDWCGFNVPVDIAKKCQKINKTETPYDLEINKILSKINEKKSYLISAGSLKSSTFKHELCHALYYTNKSYKKETDRVTKSIKNKKLKQIKKSLKKMGYCESVINDEIQAYSIENNTFKLNKKIKKKYKKIFKAYNIK